MRFLRKESSRQKPGLPFVGKAYCVFAAEIYGRIHYADAIKRASLCTDLEAAIKAEQLRETQFFAGKIVFGVVPILRSSPAFPSRSLRNIFIDFCKFVFSGFILCFGKQNKMFLICFKHLNV